MYKTKLEDRTLWADGVSEIDPAHLKEFIFKMCFKTGNQSEFAKLVAVTDVTPEIKSYNQLVDTPITTKTELSSSFPPEWNLPEQYKYLNVDEYLEKLVDRIVVDNLFDDRLARLAQEIYLFKELKIEEILRSLIYVIDVFKKKNIVWGVGRGSSCSSYIFYLMGLHEVDSVLYDIDIKDFLGKS